MSLVLNGLLLMTLIVGCVTAKEFEASPKPQIENVLEVNRSVGEGVGQAAQTIDQHVDEVDSKTERSPEIRTDILPNLSGIRVETGNLREMQGRLQATEAELESAIELSNDLEGSLVDLRKKNAELQEENKSFLRKLTAMVIVLSIVGVGAAAAMLWTGNKLGITVGVMSLATLATALIVTQYALWFAIGGGVLVLAGLAYVAYELWNRNRVSEELVATVEANKMAMRDEARQFLFGNGPIKGHINMIQSSTTQKFVDNVKRRGKVKKAPSVEPVKIGV
jgi:hypothetical protein